MTRSFRSRIARERGPGISVFRWIARVTAIGPRYRNGTTLWTRERFRRVEPDRVPEQKAARIEGARRGDLRLQVGCGVRTTEREVLQPRHEPRPGPAHRRLEV